MVNITEELKSFLVWSNYQSGFFLIIRDQENKTTVPLSYASTLRGYTSFTADVLLIKKVWFDCVPSMERFKEIQQLKSSKLIKKELANVRCTVHFNVFLSFYFFILNCLRLIKQKI